MPRRISRLLLASALLAVLPLRAQTASLVRDIVQIPSSPSSTPSALPQGLLAFHGKLLYSAQEPTSGQELWVSDGEGRGTRLLADFCPGRCSSEPRLLGASGSAVFGIEHRGHFPGDDDYFLWRSDGTREGTYLLPSTDDAVSLFFDGDVGADTAMVGNVLFSSGCSHASGCGLWRSDGTAAGTRLLQPSDASGYSAFNLTAVGRRLYYAVQRTLWYTDGTAAGTHQVQTFSSYPRLLAALGDKLFFVAPGTAGDELWTSDGTAAGTRALTSFQAPSPFDQTYWLKPLGGQVYFVADDVTHGAELWASDGTATGTRQVTEMGYFNPFGHDENDPFEETGLLASNLELLGSRLVFWATDGVDGFRPWSTAGTPESTAPLCSGCSFSNRRASLVKAGTRLLFPAKDVAHGNEIWSTDGTAAGTALLRDLCPGPCDGARSEPVPLLGAAFFVAVPSQSSGTSELWRSDGTVQGTRLFSTPGGADLAAIGSRLFFGANDPGGRYGTELWTSDGTPGGTRLVTDAARGNGSAQIANLVAQGRDAVLTTCSDYTQRLWRSDGTAAGTVESPDRTWGCGTMLTPVSAAGATFFINPGYFDPDQLWRLSTDGSPLQLTALGGHDAISQPVVLNDRVYFVVTGYNNERPVEIWRSDGTVPGTGRVITLPDNLHSPFGLRVVGSEIWFAASDAVERGNEIWRTDGTQAGTRKAVDFGANSLVFDPQFTPVGGTVFFLGPDGDDNPQIWKTDGTPQGTGLVRDLDPEPFDRYTRAYPGELTACQGNLCFFAVNPADHPSLWRTDGTAAGTVLLKSFNFDPEEINPIDPPFSGLTVVGPWLVFAADDGVHGRELWRSDGTPAGTTLLRDILPGAAGSGLASPLNAGGRILFSADDGAHGFELWQSDGTPAGTRLLQDIAPEGESSSPGHFTLAGDRVFFTADDGVTGEELWVLPLSGPACQPSTTALCLSGGRFKVEISWRDFAGNGGTGHAVPLSADTGYFWFFDAANVETIVKVLDGRAANGHFWVFYGALSNVEYTMTVTDAQTGLSRRYFNPAGQFASVGDTEGFGPLGAYSATAVAKAGLPPQVAERAAATGTCVPSSRRLCLNGGRFAVEASWKDFSGHTGAGTAVPLSGDTGYFWFFDAANVEAVVKVLDGTPVNGHFWVYYGALSNVEYKLTVTDTLTGHVKTYTNPQGRFASVGDGAAF
jgi:ELWxxDGT repeat protein